MTEEKTDQPQPEQPAETPEASTPETPVENWEEKYKNLESNHTKTSQELADQTELVNTISPYVDWGKVHGEPEEQQEQQEDPAAKLMNLERKVDTKLMTLQFRQDHPELRPYEDTITGPALVQMRRKYPHEPMNKTMERAAKFTTEFLEKERAKGEEAAAKKSQKAAAAGGLGSAGVSSQEKKPESGGQSMSEYSAARRAQSRKARGMFNVSERTKQ
jgi:hypothetical protein